MRPSSLAILAVAVGATLLAFVLWPEDEADPPQPAAEGALHAPTLPEARLAAEQPEPALVEVESPRVTEANRAPAQIAGPRGRVVEGATDRPVAGLTVQLRFGAKVLAETVTQADGTFHLPPPDRSRRIVAVAAPEWRASPRNYRLDDGQSEGRTELVFQVERIIEARLRGRLVDQRTGEPVPEFLVGASGPHRPATTTSNDDAADEDGPTTTVTFHVPARTSEKIVTGADGTFASSKGFEGGLLKLKLFDHPDLVPEDPLSDDTPVLEHHHVVEGATPPAEQEFRIAIGPTYRFDMTLPEGTQAKDFYASFPSTVGGVREFHRLTAEDPNSPMAAFLGGMAGTGIRAQEAPLRGADPVWARFRLPVDRDAEPSEASGTNELHVRSRDGHWSGTSAVTSVVGVHPGVVPITLTANGVIEGTVLGIKGKAVPTAWIQISSLSVPSQLHREAGADRKGGFAFEWLSEGEYEVVVQTDRYDEWRRRVTLAGGSTERLDVRLSAGVELGNISGVLRGRTGRHRSPKGGFLTLLNLNDPASPRFKIATYRKVNGMYQAAFTFEDVPSGQYELRLDPLDNMRWDAVRMTISPPAGGLEFVCEDEGPTYDFGFRAIDAESGGPIEETWAIVWHGDPLEDQRLDEDWETKIYNGVPEGVPLSWVLRAKGYRLAKGDETVIRAGTDHRVAEVKLVRGWGQLFKVMTKNQEPIAGVELLADGNSVGVTDAQGMVSMDLGAKPQSLEFRYEAWHVSSGAGDPRDDHFGWGPETEVYLSPNP